jgi:hypothetical protein
LPVLAVEPGLLGAPLRFPLPEPLVASGDPLLVPRKPEEYGGWQTIDTITGGRTVGGRAFAPPVTAPPSTAPLLGVDTTAGAISVVIETHVQAAGQSESTLQVVALG